MNVDLNVPWWMTEHRHHRQLVDVAAVLPDLQAGDVVRCEPGVGGSTRIYVNNQLVTVTPPTDPNVLIDDWPPPERPRP